MARKFAGYANRAAAGKANTNRCSHGKDNRRSDTRTTPTRSPPTSRDIAGQARKAIGVSVGTIQHYEHGRTRITDDRLDQLAQALQCARLELLMPPGSPLPPY
jgi:hypothetical protein